MRKAGFKDPNTVLKKIKELKPGQAFLFPDGCILSAEDAVEAKEKGRKLVILGDTACSDAMTPIAMHPDILVHEATNSWDPATAVRHVSYEQLERDAKKHGHSTPEMAGAFAKKILAKKLILTHFSARYAGDASSRSMVPMWNIEDKARETSGLWGTNDVIAAWDYMHLTIPLSSSSKLSISLPSPPSPPMAIVANTDT